MNFAAISKLLLPAAGVALTVASSIVGSKNQEATINKIVSEKVAEALKNQAKES